MLRIVAGLVLIATGAVTDAGGFRTGLASSLRVVLLVVLTTASAVVLVTASGRSRG